MNHLISAIIVFATLLSSFLDVRGGVSIPESFPDDPYTYPGVTIRFENFQIEDGLSQNSGFALLQDQQGYIWIGTQEGLNRYDGYNFTIFKHQPQNSNSLSHNSILDLFEDSQGYIWIGTWGGGLNRFDPATQSFTHYQNDPNNPDSLSHDLVTVIHEDPAGNLWVGTMNGLDLLNRETGEFKHFQVEPSNQNTVSSNAISALYADQNGILWVGTGAFGIRGYRLNRLEVATGNFERISLNCVAEAAISKIMQDHQGILWLGHGGYNVPGSGITRFDPRSGECTNYRSDPEQPDSLSDNNVTDLLLDDHGGLWVTTYGGGINRMNLSAPGEFTRFQHDPYNADSLSSDNIFSIAVDRTGILWIGTINGGINKLNPVTLAFRYYFHTPANPVSLSSNQIGAFAENPDGRIWIGTWESGLNLFNPSTGEFNSSAYDLNDPSSLGGKTISALETNTDQELWIGFRGSGIDRLNLNTGEFTHYRHRLLDPSSLWNNEVMDLLHNGESDLWIATLAGLDHMDTTTSKFTHYVHDPSKPNGLSHPSVISLYLDENNQLWIGTWGGGLNRLDLNNTDNLSPLNASFVHYRHDPNNPNSLGDDTIWAIYQTEDDIFWLGTQGGLNRFDPVTGNFSVYRELEGFQGETVYGILEDDNGFLWLTTNNGLVKFNPETENLIVYDRTNGLQSSEFNPNAYFRSKNGDFYVGGNQGFNVFSPTKIQANLLPPPIVITEFTVLNEPYETDLTGQSPIELKYNQNFISFEFAALDFHAPNKNKYAFRLEGIDPNWIESGTRPFANYTDLPGGEYTFRVKAANIDGVWNDEGLSIPLIITPPFWETLPFQFFAAIFLLGIVVAVFQWRVRDLRARSRNLETSVQERTQALSETNIRLTEEIDQRQKAEAALAQKAAEEAVTSERTRLAHEFHDAVTQTLFSASLIAEVLPDMWKIDTDEAKSSTNELRQLTRGALAEMRTLLLELRPAALTQARLADLLQQLTEATVGRARVPIFLTIEGERALPPDVKIVFYRIAQESIHNIIKHARATQVTIDLQLSPTGANLEISDNGIGFELDKVKPTSLGVRIMGERAAKIGADFQIRSTLGDGTTIIVTWYDKTTKES